MKSKSADIRNIPAAVEAYFAAIPTATLPVLLELRSIIGSAAPAEATEAMSYAMPAFKHNGTIVCYGAFTNHVSLFPMGNAAIQHFAEELKPYATSKGTIRFSLDRPLPIALIRKIVKARVAANEKKKPAKAATAKKV